MIIDSRKLNAPTPKGCHGFLENYVIPSGLGRMFASFYNRFIPSGFDAVK
jgi:hypothetical protein